jgi:hypothetical protein
VRDESVAIAGVSGTPAKVVLQQHGGRLVRRVTQGDWPARLSYDDPSAGTMTVSEAESLSDIYLISLDGSALTKITHGG